MGTLSSLLNLSLSALQANQTAIDITSNNVANANTPGYTKETANWQEVDSVSLSGVSVGAGTSVSESSVRDRVLEQRVQQQTQLASSSAAQSTALTQLQSVFGLTSSSTSASSTTLGSDMNAFFNSLTTLQANPSGGSARQAVLSALQTMTGDFNSAAGQISAQTAGLNQQVTGVVSQVNSLTASIAQLNSQIASTSPDADAGTLEDQRQQDLAQLSQLIGFNQTKTENNGLTLTTTNGAPLVSEGVSYPLGTAVVNGNVDVLAAAATGGQDITSGMTGGQLGGVLQARDQDLPQVSSQLDTLAWDIGIQVNAQNGAGTGANGYPGVALFTLPPSVVGAAAGISPGTNNPDQIAAAGAGEGLAGSTNAGALSALQNATFVNGQTPAGFFASFLTQLGDTASSVTNSNTVQQASLTQLTTQRDALSGVSLDQEAASLTKYQNSYQAAAKVFSIVDTLMAAALNLGQETTVT